MRFSVWFCINIYPILHDDDGGYDAITALFSGSTREKKLRFLDNIFTCYPTVIYSLRNKNFPPELLSEYERREVHEALKHYEDMLSFLDNVSSDKDAAVAYFARTLYHSVRGAGTAVNNPAT